MARSPSTSENRSPGTPLTAGQPAHIPVIALGLSLSLLFTITFVLCVIFDLLYPNMAMYQTWLRLLPGFTWLSWPSFLLGVVESFGYGWYVALIFGLFFNYFASWRL